MDRSAAEGLNRRAALAWGAAAAALPQAGRAAQARPVIINALGGLEDPNPGSPGARDHRDPLSFEKPDVNDRAIREARAAGLTAVNVTLGYVAGEQESFEYSVRTIGAWDETIRARPGDLIKVHTAADILRARDTTRIGVIYGFQNAAMMGDKPERVDIFADLGVRVIQLTYNPRNQLGGGALDPEGRGLTPFGRQVVERLNARRVMVDLSHSGRQICLDAARASKQPISINHTGCRALADLPRNKTDEELRLVADKGGFVGIYFMPFLRVGGRATAKDVVAHIEHALKVCGEDHVGIGTDGNVTTLDDIAAYDKELAKEHAARVKAGVAAPGEAPGVYPFLLDLRGPEQFRKLDAMLRARGHPQARVDKVMGLNFLRFAREVWGA
ncbi:MAG TPA: membrane dipeptidase [Caulobacteraceae bacterium]|jgi:membrane dipeptidase